MSPSTTLERVISQFALKLIVYDAGKVVKFLKNALTILLGILLWPFAIIVFYNFLKRKWRIRKKQQKLKALLDGRALADVLQAAPFGYGHFQGDDGYRIWDERTKSGFVEFVYTPLDAELWIVEKYLSEKAP